MRSICFPLYFMADERIRLLSSYEIADFAFRLVPLAAMQRGQPGVIPAMPLATLARKLGLPAKRVLRRLETLSAPGVELIALEHDGDGKGGDLSLLSTVYVEILDFAEWNGLDDAPPISEPFHHSSNGNGVGVSSNAARQARHRDKKADLKRQLAQVEAEIEADNEQGNGNNNGNSNASGANSNAQALQNGSKSVTSSVTSSVTQSVTSGPKEALHPSRAGDDNVQRNGLDLNSLDKNSTLNVTGVTPVTLSSASSSSIPSPPNSASNSSSSPPNLRGRLLATQAVCMARDLGDGGSESRHYQLLAVCEQNGVRDLPTEALRVTKRKMGRGALEKPPGAYYQGTLTKMLADRGIHVPTKEELEAEPPGDVARLIRESLAAAETERLAAEQDKFTAERSAPPPPPRPLPRRAVITPLEDIGYPAQEDE